jgi:hypothetical protein
MWKLHFASVQIHHQNMVAQTSVELTNLSLTIQRGGTSAARVAETSHVEGWALHAVTHSTISQQRMEQMYSGCLVRVAEDPGSRMVWETIPRNYVFIFSALLEIGVLFLHLYCSHVQAGPGAHPASCTMGTGYFLGVRRPGRGADHPPPPSAEVENE